MYLCSLTTFSWLWVHARLRFLNTYRAVLKSLQSVRIYSTETIIRCILNEKCKRKLCKPLVLYTYSKAFHTAPYGNYTILK